MLTKVNHDGKLAPGLTSSQGHIPTSHRKVKTAICLHEGLPLSKCSYKFSKGRARVVASRMQRQEDMGSARYVTCCVTLGRVTRTIFVFAGTVAALGDAFIAVVNHIAFV